MSNYMLSIQEYDVKQFDSNNHFLDKFNKEPETDYNKVFCNVMDNDDVICEEIVIESPTRRSNDSEGVNIEFDDDVICIEDSDDEKPSDKIIKAVASEGVFCVPVENEMPIDVSCPQPDNVPEQVATIDEVLYNIGFNLILCKFYSSDDCGAKGLATGDNIDHLDLSLKHCKCGFKTESAFVFDSHVNFLDGVPARCCICESYAARNFKRLSIHMKTRHNIPNDWAKKRQPYQCQFCNHDASARSSLMKHAKKCMTRFTLNSNLAPRLMEKELHSLLPDSRPQSSRNVSVIHLNPKSKTSKNNSSDNLISFFPTQQSVIVPNTVGYQVFPSLLECGYCKASIKDLQSLGIHMEVMHNIQYSFHNSEFLIEEVPVINIADGNASAEDVEDVSELSSHEEKNFKNQENSRAPGLLASRNNDEVEVEKELAKMAIRKECLWCYRSFKSLDHFEEHMVRVHDDLKCNAEGFWLAIQGGLSECFGFEIALSRVCPYCSSSFASPSSCHRHILNCHWELHLEECGWCQKVVTFRSTFSLEYGNDGLEAVDGDDSSSSSSFMSDIDSKEASR